MHKQKELLIFDHPLKLYTHLSLPPDCINDKDEFSIVNFGDFPLPLPYTSPSFRANFYSFIFANPGHIRQFS